MMLFASENFGRLKNNAKYDRGVFQICSHF